MYNYKHETEVEADIDSTFAWFEHEGSFRRLMPPWEVAEEIRADDSLDVGSQRVFRFPMGPLNMTWVAEHTAYCLLYTSPSPRDLSTSRMPSSA